MGRRPGSADYPHIFRLQALLALRGVEFNLLTFLEAAVPAADDGGEMHEHIRAAALDLDEAVALLRVEPLHGALRHDRFLPRFGSRAAAASDCSFRSAARFRHGTTRTLPRVCSQYCPCCTKANAG